MSYPDSLARALTPEEIAIAKANQVATCFENEECSRTVAYVVAMWDEEFNNRRPGWSCLESMCPNHAQFAPIIMAAAAPGFLQPLGPTTPEIDMSTWGKSRHHVGYAGARMPDGALTDTRRLTDMRAVARDARAYVASCHCGWSDTAEHPPTAAGLGAAESRWRELHLHVLFQHVIKLGVVLGHFYGPR